MRVSDPTDGVRSSFYLQTAGENRILANSDSAQARASFQQSGTQIRTQFWGVGALRSFDGRFHFDLEAVGMYINKE